MPGNKKKRNESLILASLLKNSGLLQRKKQETERRCVLGRILENQKRPLIEINYTFLKILNPYELYPQLEPSTYLSRHSWEYSRTVTQREVRYSSSLSAGPARQDRAAPTTVLLF